MAITGVLESLREGDEGAGGTAVIRVGGLLVIVTEFRKECHGAEDFSAIGLGPLAADIVVAKIGYLELSLDDIARGLTRATSIRTSNR